MSSKIDGVPRELLVRLNNLHATGNDIDIEMAEVRQLLDAPVVERQPLTDNTFIRGWKVGTKYFGLRMEAVEWIRTGQASAFGEDTKLMPLYFENHSTELAELQATIAQQAAEIERLKGGQGEPVAWQAFSPSIGPSGHWLTCTDDEEAQKMFKRGYAIRGLCVQPSATEPR